MTDFEEIEGPPTRSTSDSGAWTLRPRVTQDDARVVAIYNLLEADSLPLTVARYRAEHTQPADKALDCGSEQWIAQDRDGFVVGVGSFHPAWWTGRPGIYAADIRVDPSQGRQGIGSRLYGLLRSRLLSRQASHLLGWVRADEPKAGRRFAARHGFRETGQVVQEYRLYVPDAKTDGQKGLEERLGRAGLRIASLAELDRNGKVDEMFLRALQQVWAADPGQEQPAAPEPIGDSFGSWQREVLHAPGLSPRTHWVALEEERPVGMTFLKRLSDETAENDYTGVASTHRGRGIAAALKLRAIAWAQQHGLSWFYTSSEVGNAPMIALNRRLGYEPGVKRLEVALNLP